MLHTKFQIYIHDQIEEVVKRKYPNEPLKQALYARGFLESQLATAMLNDSRVGVYLRETLNEHGYNKPKQ